MSRFLSRSGAPAALDTAAGVKFDRLMRNGSLALADFPADVVRLDCPTCGRSGRYSRARLVERFGPDIALPDLLMEIAACERRRASASDAARGIQTLR